jgi:hypothetical protein
MVVTGTGADEPRCRVTSWRRLPAAQPDSESHRRQDRRFKKNKGFACEPEGTLYYDRLYLPHKLKYSERFCFLAFSLAFSSAPPAPAIR